MVDLLIYSTISLSVESYSKYYGWVKMHCSVIFLSVNFCKNLIIDPCQIPDLSEPIYEIISCFNELLK